ncbi:DUF3221 domain-containing protein [Alkalihalobacterium alkalicellulosilyticum]|uniref:DUF3221 domain-containing protein n=1 Tax=Alkalihalobacterium alkalicellulosilyticum TaxID=1912214 RepID=UPI000998D405|nr:DUF3221 domain-containing protein [Bacillus alkalicellulosilyticus]
MKKSIHGVILSLLLLTLIGCNTQGAEVDEASPFYTGEITIVSGSSIHVEGKSEVYDSPEFVFHTDDNTAITNETNDTFSIVDLSKGQKVLVWVEKEAPVMESYPPQVTALKIKVTN